MNRPVVHQMFVLNSSGSGVTSVTPSSDGVVVDNALGPNPVAINPMRLRGISIMALCAVVNNPGDWTLGLHINKSGTASYSFTFPCAAFVPNSTVSEGAVGAIVLQQGDNYHLTATGPSRDTVLGRIVVEWEILT